MKETQIILENQIVIMEALKELVSRTSGTEKASTLETQIKSTKDYLTNLN